MYKLRSFSTGQKSPQNEVTIPFKPEQTPFLIFSKLIL